MNNEKFQSFRSGSLTSTMSQRVEEKLKLDTQLMKRTKEHIVDVLDQKLRNMGLDEVSVLFED